MVNHEQLYPESIQVKFMNVSCRPDETIQIAIRLNIDPRKPNQSVRGSTLLPHGLGKEISVAVFATGSAADKARDAGADIVGAEDLAEQIAGGNIVFDRCICTPDMLGVNMFFMAEFIDFYCQPNRLLEEWHEY